MRNFQDKLITCADCTREFLWSAGEQEYYADREMTQPKRCKDCRAKRKARLDERDQREGRGRA